MGKMEQDSKKRARRGEVQEMVLHTVATAGIIGVALVAPNVLGALHKLGFDITGRKKEIVNRSRKRLIDEGMLEYAKDGYLRLTEKGQRKLRQLERKNYALPRPSKWDKKWRVLIFDIKENRRWLRDKVRSTLVAMGFVRLQDSVWVYPYDCEDLITPLKADFEIGKDLLYMIVDRIEHDREIRSRFDLR